MDKFATITALFTFAALAPACIITSGDDQASDTATTTATGSTGTTGGTASTGGTATTGTGTDTGTATGTASTGTATGTDTAGTTAGTTMAETSTTGETSTAGTTEGTTGPAAMCGWDDGNGYYECGFEGEDPGGENPIACPDGLVEGDPCETTGLTGQGCCDADGNNWYCTQEGTVFFNSCG